MVKVENNIVSIDFPTVFECVNRIMQMSIRCGIDDTCLNECELHIPIVPEDNPYIDISFPDKYFNVKPT